MPPPRPIAGQASTEYVALLAVVCAIVAGVAAVGSVPPIAAQVARQVKHGICLVAGGICTPREARAAGLGPCLVQVRTDRERLGGRVLVVKVGRDDSLLIQRRSDGTAAVSFADGGTLGASFGVGLQFAGHGGNARGGGGLRFTSGRTWEFPTVAAASRFLHRWAHTETLTGELRGILPGGAHPPEPDATYKEGGAYLEYAASVGLRPGTEASLGAEASAVMGRRIEPGGRVTWYDRIDGETAGELGVVLGSLQRHDAGQAAFEITTVHGRPVELRVSAAARVHGELAPPGPVSSLADLGDRLQGVRSSPGGCARWRRGSTPRARSTCACSATASRRTRWARTSGQAPASARATTARRRRATSSPRGRCARAGACRSVRTACPRNRSAPRAYIVTQRTIPAGEVRTGHLTTPSPRSAGRVRKGIPGGGSQKEDKVEFMKRLEPVWLALVLLGALNWALVALFDFNVVEEILGTGTAADVVYVIVGFAAVALLPKLAEGLHLGDRAHPRGA